MESVSFCGMGQLDVDWDSFAHNGLDRFSSGTPIKFMDTWITLGKDIEINVNLLLERTEKKNEKSASE